MTIPTKMESFALAAPLAWGPGRDHHLYLYAMYPFRKATTFIVNMEI